MPTVESERPSINQQAIHVDADKFSALVDSMGDKALYQRFTLHNRGAVEPGVPDAAKVQELEDRAPIDVSVDLQTTFTFGGPDNPARQQWLDENSIKPGEEVVVRIEDQSGKLVERTVSTDPNMFFIPVDKLVQIETDEFEHAEIVPRKYPVGASVVVERNVYDENYNIIGKTLDKEGWKVVGHGTKKGSPSTTVRKIEGDQAFDKDFTNAELEAFQAQSSAELQRPPVSAPEAHKMGHQELESAGLIKPEADKVSSPVIEAASENKPEIKQETPEEEVAKLNIDIQRKIRDYELYMNSADRSIQANGHNRDAEDDRRRANGIISVLPTAMRDLAKRYYQAKYNS